MRRHALALALLCLPPLAATAEAQTRPLTPRQYTLIMEGSEVGVSGYERLTTPHKALAACIRWAEVKSDRVPVVAVRSFGGGNVAQARREAMELCTELEKAGNCKCRLVDVDDKPAR